MSRAPQNERVKEKIKDKSRVLIVRNNYCVVVSEGRSLAVINFHLHKILKTFMWLFQRMLYAEQIKSTTDANSKHPFLQR